MKTTVDTAVFRGITVVQSTSCQEKTAELLFVSTMFDRQGSGDIWGVAVPGDAGCATG